MTAPAIAPHLCNTDPFAICECGRVGYGTYRPDVRPRTAEAIEAVFEFVEAADEPFLEATIWLATGIANRGSIAKTLRLMEHHGMVRRRGRVYASGRPVLWERAQPVGPVQPGQAS